MSLHDHIVTSLRNAESSCQDEKSRVGSRTNIGELYSGSKPLVFVSLLHLCIVFIILGYNLITSKTSYRSQVAIPTVYRSIQSAQDTHSVGRGCLVDAFLSLTALGV